MPNSSEDRLKTMSSTSVRELSRNAEDPLSEFRSSEAWFTPSNAISAMRAVMLVPAVFAIAANYPTLALSIFVIAFLSDLLDGYLARKLKTVSEIGKVIDPLADKIFIGGVILTMGFTGHIPIWFMGVVIFRDLIIFAVGVWATRKLSVVLPSNYYGKGAVLTISLTLFLALLEISPSVLALFEYVSVALMAASLVSYGTRLASLLRKTTA